MDEQGVYTITVRQIGVAIVHREQYTGTMRQVENRASAIWTNHGYSFSDRYRLKIHRKGDQKAYLTIG